MTPGNTLRNIAALSLVVLSAIPAFAADGKKRGVQKPPSNPIVSPQPPPGTAEVTLAAGVRDDVTDLPVINAEVFATNPDRYARTDANGAFTMKLPAGAAVNLQILRAGYKPYATTITTAAVGIFVQRYRQPHCSEPDHSGSGPTDRERHDRVWIHRPVQRIHQGPHGGDVQGRRQRALG